MSHLSTFPDILLFLANIAQIFWQEHLNPYALFKQTKMDMRLSCACKHTHSLVDTHIMYHYAWVELCRCSLLKNTALKNEVPPAIFLHILICNTSDAKVT